MLDTKDWLTDHLATQPGVLVGDRDWLHQLYGISSGAQFSLRLMSDPRHGTHLPVLVVRHDDPRVLERLDVAPQMRDLRKRVLRIFNDYERISVIVAPATHCTLSEARFGFYVGALTRGYTRLLTARQLGEYLAARHPAMAENPGAGKEIFNEVRDAFQHCTRAYLCKNLICQACDVLRLVAGRQQVVELKRFCEAVETWQPYVNDARNFAALISASKATGLLPPLCVGYRKVRGGDHPLVAVHTVTRATYDEIDGVCCTARTDDMWSVHPTMEYTSTRRVPRRG